jgi:hypothetical protein
MVLALFSRRDDRAPVPSTSPQPATPTTPGALSPARQALQDHRETIAALSARNGELHEHLVASAQASATMTHANNEFEAVAELEAKAWREFIAGGAHGPKPEPMTALRVERAAALANAKATLEAVSRTAEAVYPLTVDNSSRLRDLTAQTHSYIHAVMLEEARHIAARYITAAREALLSEATLEGLADAFRARGYGPGVVAIKDLMAGGPPLEAMHYRQALDAALKKRRTAWRGLAEKLEHNSAATSEDEP